MSDITGSNVVYLRASQKDDTQITEEQVRLESLYFQAFERLTHLRDVVNRLKDETDNLQDCVQRLSEEAPPRE